MDSAALRCCGETVGRVRTARGPVRMGSSSWRAPRLRLLRVNLHTRSERPWVSVASRLEAGVDATGVELATLGWVSGEKSKLGFQNSTTWIAEAKMPVWTTWIFVSLPVYEVFPFFASSSSTLCSALASSRLMPIHSLALRLLCWKITIRGVERRRDWYCRCSCDFRNSGGLCDGGCVRGYRAMGGAVEMVCSMGGAGVVAVANEACRHCQQM